MKNFKSFSIILFLFISFSSYSQLKVNSAGNVGIGVDADASYELKLNTAMFYCGGTYPYLIIKNDPTYYGKVIRPSVNEFCRLGLDDYKFMQVHAKNYFASGTYTGSDIRLKENFRDIETPLKKLLQVKGLKYDLKNQQNDSLLNNKQKEKQEKMRKDKLGFVAQDLEKLFPEAVYYDDEADKYYIEYNAIIPVIVEAMKEQQSQIEELKNEMIDCCSGNLKSGATNNTEELNINGIQAKLYQNTPNPFSTQTDIRFEIPVTVESAQLHICNMTGTLLKTIPVNHKGEGYITINANEFTAGMYLYSLVCNGKIVDTKQMLLTE